jgi:hypothetical protein
MRARPYALPMGRPVTLFTGQWAEGVRFALEVHPTDFAPSAIAFDAQFK